MNFESVYDIFLSEFFDNVKIDKLAQIKLNSIMTNFVSWLSSTYLNELRSYEKNNEETADAPPTIIDMLHRYIPTEIMRCFTSDLKIDKPNEMIKEIIRKYLNLKHKAFKFTESQIATFAICVEYLILELIEISNHIRMEESRTILTGEHIVNAIKIDDDFLELTSLS